jgi:hypothetical protein
VTEIYLGVTSDIIQKNCSTLLHCSSPHGIFRISKVKALSTFKSKLFNTNL